MRDEIGENVRAGAQTLTLLGGSRTALILDALGDGPKGQLALRRATWAPAQSTLRGNLRGLEEVQAISRHPRKDLRNGLEYELTESGRESLAVIDGLRHWLAESPSGALELGGDPARAAIKGLVVSWSIGVLAGLAAKPRSLTELDKAIPDASYPTIERCLETMRLAEQVHSRRREPSGTPHALTDWLRRGIVPLALAARWEDKHNPPGADPIARDDLEAATGILAPLIDHAKLPIGACQLSLSVPSKAKPKRSMAAIKVTPQGLSWNAAYPRQKPDAWATGPTEAWFKAVLDGDPGDLRIRGNRELPQALLRSLCEVSALRPAAGAFSGSDSRSR